MEEDYKLIQSVIRGDRAAFQRLVERYQNFVFTIALKVLKSREEAEETAQDVFVKVYKTLATFEQKSKFSTWLYTITYRTALDRARRKNQQTQSLDEEASFLQIEDTGWSTSPATGLQKEDLQQQLQLAIDQLQPEDATLITLFYLKENTVPEIAKITGLTVTNIKTKLHRLREALKRHLSRQLQTEIKDLL